MLVDYRGKVELTVTQQKAFDAIKAAFKKFLTAQNKTETYFLVG